MTADDTKRLLEIVEKVDVSSIKDNLKEIDTLLAVLDRVEKLANSLNKIGILPAAIKVLGKQHGIENIAEPLNNPLSIIAKSTNHLVLFTFLNQMTDEQAQSFYQNLIVSADKEARKKPKAIQQVVSETK